jgi:DNA-binding transcriptional MerR regulator
MGLYTIRELATLLDLSERNVRHYLSRYDIAPEKKGNPALYGESARKMLEIVREVSSSDLCISSLTEHYLDLARSGRDTSEALCPSILETNERVVSLIEEFRRLDGRDIGKADEAGEMGAAREADAIVEAHVAGEAREIEPETEERDALYYLEMFAKRLSSHFTQSTKAA